MFTETAVALIIIGLLVGALAAAWFVELFRCDPLREHNHALKQQQATRSWEAEKDAIQYQAFKNTHRGTPYINPPPSAVERLLADITDNDCWSVKAPADLPDNVRAIGGNQ